LSNKLELVESKKKELEDAIARATQRANDDKALYSEELTQKMTQQAGEVEKQVEDL
jgi:flavin-binding protein dodecin